MCCNADTYKEAASDIANEAARDLSVEEYHEQHDAKAHFETYQRRALWASLVARQMAAEARMADDVPNLDEQIGNVLFEELSNAPPLCDQLSKVVVRLSLGNVLFIEFSYLLGKTCVSLASCPGSPEVIAKSG